jgi:N-acetylmuramoyl-L-alanine amidase
MPKQKRKYLVIHCTATQEGMPVTPEMIKQWHLLPPPRGRGWNQVGYSKLILLNGVVHSFVQDNDDEFVDQFEITNGVAGINSVSMSICYVGGIDKYLHPKDTRTDAQKLSLKEIVLLTIKKQPDIKIAGHYHFAKKACPSFDVEKWCESIGVPEKNIYRAKK